MCPLFSVGTRELQGFAQRQGTGSKGAMLRLLPFAAACFQPTGLLLTPRGPKFQGSDAGPTRSALRAKVEKGK